MKKNYIVQICVGVFTLAMYFLLGVKGIAFGVLFSFILVFIINLLFIKEEKDKITINLFKAFKRKKEYKDKNNFIFDLKVASSTFLAMLIYFILIILFSSRGIVIIKNDINYLKFVIPLLFFLNGIFGLFYFKNS